MGKRDGKRCQQTAEAVISMGLPSLLSGVCSALLFAVCVFSSQRDGFQICTLFNSFSTLGLLNMLSPLKKTHECTIIGSSPNKRFRFAAWYNNNRQLQQQYHDQYQTPFKFKGGVTLPETNIAPEGRSSQKGRLVF